MANNLFRSHTIIPRPSSRAGSSPWASACSILCAASASNSTASLSTAPARPLSRGQRPEQQRKVRAERREEGLQLLLQHAAAAPPPRDACAAATRRRRCGNLVADHSVRHYCRGGVPDSKLCNYTRAVLWPGAQPWCAVLALGAALLKVRAALRAAGRSVNRAHTHHTPLVVDLRRTAQLTDRDHSFALRTKETAPVRLPLRLWRCRRWRCRGAGVSTGGASTGRRRRRQRNIAPNHAHRSGPGHGGRNACCRGAGGAST